MQYQTFLKQSPAGCPFCEKEAFDPRVLITSNRRAMVTVAKGPYVADQVLIIPKRHVENFIHLSLLEMIDCYRLMRWVVNRYQKLGVGGYNILLRDGEGVGKSIPHLHIHLIPNFDMVFKNSSRNRRVLTPTEIKKTIKKLF